MAGLSFLNTFFLWGLAAAAIPIAIHLIKRNRAVKMPFAAMRFLLTAHTERYKSQRLKQWLLLLMRIAAFLLVALAFARPFFANSTLAWNDEPQAAVVLLDNSFSMSYASNLAKAVERAKEQLRSFNPGDHVAVMQFSEETKTVLETQEPLDTASGQLDDRIEISNAGTDYRQALQSAEAFLTDSRLQRKSVYLISDFQEPAWSTLNQNLDLDSDIKVHPVPVLNQDAKNVAITDLLIASSGSNKQRKNVLAKVTNFGQESAKIKAQLFLNNKRNSGKNIQVESGEEGIVQFGNVLFPKGDISGWVEVTAGDEDVRVDNRYYFVSMAEKKPGILAVNGEPDSKDAANDELFFIDHALNLPGLGKYTLKQVGSAQVNSTDLSDFSAIVMANVRDLPRDQVERIVTYVRNGGGIVFALGDRVSVSIFNRLFNELIPCDLEHLAFEKVDRSQSRMLAEIDYQHSIFQIFSDPGHSDPSVAEFYQYFVAKPNTDGEVIASFDDGAPALLERRLGDGRVILMTSTLDAEWTNLPIKSLYLPLLYQIVDYVASESKGQRSYLVSNDVPMHNLVPPSPSGFEGFVVEKPSGDKVPVSAQLFEETDELGIYNVVNQQGRTVAQFAVNFDTRESDFRSISGEALANAAANMTGETVQTAGVGGNGVNLNQESSQKLWRFILLAAVLLLIGETWLANRTYR
jgi:hypothetical protein